MKAKLKLVIKLFLSQIKKWKRRINKISVDEVIMDLKRLPIVEGDSIFVHSMMSNVGYINGDLKGIVDYLVEAVGPSGHIFMPTYTSEGYSVDYLESNQVYDCRNTKSKMGILTEIFRKRSDVERSLHPTHSVAVWGSNRKEFIDEHHLDVNPFGVKSPFYKFLHLQNSKVLCLGVTIFPVTLFRVYESVINDKYPLKVFLDREFKVSGIDSVGNEMEMKTLAHNPVVSGFRRNMLFENFLIEKQLLKQFKVGNSRSFLLNTSNFYNLCEEEFFKGNLPYLNYYKDFEKYKVDTDRLFTVKS